MYRDPQRETWRAAGYAVGAGPSYSAYELVNPVSITRMDFEGRVLDEIQAVRSPEVRARNRNAR